MRHLRPKVIGRARLRGSGFGYPQKRRKTLLWFVEIYPAGERYGRLRPLGPFVK